MKKNSTRNLLIVTLAIQTLALPSISYAAPNRILARDRIAKWDYHRSNYDENGDIRIKPSTTLFDTENEGVKIQDSRLPKIYVDEIDYGNDVIIDVNMDSNDSQKWLDSIYKITKVDNEFSDNKKLEQNIQYKIENNKITLYSKSRAIDSNDVHRIKIYSTGYGDKEILIHIVKTGKIVLSGSTLSYNDVIFKLEDFNYGIKNPVYEVLLDDEVLEGNCEEYHIVSELIRLENKALDKLTPGKHKIVVKAFGYKNFEKEFFLDKNKRSNIEFKKHNNEKIDEIFISNKKTSLDAVSAATKKGSETSDIDVVSSATGSTVQNINLVFDFDLVANAKILEGLSLETEYSKKVLDRWNSSIKEYVQEDNDENLYTWMHYQDSINEYKLRDEYLSFQDYLKTENPTTTKNRSYAYKFVLEDGLLGDVQRYDQVGSKSVKVEEVKDNIDKENVELKAEDIEFIKNIEKIYIGNTEISKNEYNIEGNKINLNINRFSTGRNTVKIISKGYNDIYLEISRYKEIEEFEISKTKDMLKISGVNDDYIKNFKGIFLNGKGLFNKSQVGSGEDYNIEDNNIYIL